MNVEVKIELDLGPLRGLTRKLNAAAHGIVGVPPSLRDMYDAWAKVYMDFIRLRFQVFSRGGGDWPALSLATILARRGKVAKGLRKAVSVESRAAREEFKRYYKVRLQTIMSRRGLKPTPALRKDKMFQKRLNQAKNLAKAQAAGDIRRAGGRMMTRKAAIAGLVPAQWADVAILRDTGTLLQALTIGMPGSYKERIPGGIEVGIGGPSRHDNESALTIGDIAKVHHEGEGRVPQREILVPPDDQTMRTFKSIAESALIRLIAEG